MAMTESKNALMARLRRERRWDEACKFREQARQRLLGEGVKRAEAKERAWAEMAAAYPQLPPEALWADDDQEPTDDEEELVDHDQDADPKAEDAAPEAVTAPSDLLSDFQWVFEHVGEKAIRLAEAPSKGAWSLLMWARKNPDRFYNLFVGKAVGLLAKREEQRAEDEKARRHHSAQMGDLGNRLQKVIDDFRAKLIRNVPEAIQDRVRGAVGIWRHWSGLDMTMEAETELGYAMATIAQDVILAVKKDPNAFDASNENQWSGQLKRSTVSLMTGQPDRPTSADGDETPQTPGEDRSCVDSSQAKEDQAGT